MLKKLSLLAGTALLLAGCGEEEAQDSSEDTEEVETADTTDTTDTESAEESSETPEETHLKIYGNEQYAEIIDIAIDNLEEPYTGELISATDHTAYNDGVQHGDAYASFAQHKPFMELYNENNDGDLVAVQPIYNSIVGFYSEKYDSIDDIEDGGKVVLPDDPANEARALHVLAQNDLIELEDEDELFVTVDDVKENPHNFEFETLPLANLRAAYEDGDELVFSYPAFMKPIDITPDDAVILEKDQDDIFALQLVVHKDNENTPETQALIKAFTSDDVIDFLDNNEEAKYSNRSF